MQINEILNNIGKKSKVSQKEIAASSHQIRNKILKLCAKKIKQNTNLIIEANKIDVSLAKKNGLKNSYIDRLNLDVKRVKAMAKSLSDISKLPDPLDRKSEEWKRPNGLRITKRPTPLGVLGVIYESRPNVTADAAGLSIKSGNSVILKCGSDSFNSCEVISELIRKSLTECKVSSNVVQMVPSKNREVVDHMLKMSGIIDVIIPRGGKSLVEKVQNDARVPVFSHLEGICHIYVDEFANFEKSVSVVVNGKMRRTGICGATESLLINNKIARSFLPIIYSDLKTAGCEMVGDKKSKTIISEMELAKEEDWSTEYLGPKISIKIVDDLNDAIKHIEKFGSQHTDAIMTENKANADFFTKSVDSAIVMVNASTQFADGGEFGLGAEIGISTGRLHARGPVGAEQLTSFKYVVHGNGQIRP
jgi:glutamate-5-semialdehyde dehydrogenase